MLCVPCMLKELNMLRMLYVAIIPAGAALPGGPQNRLGWLAGLAGLAGWAGWLAGLTEGGNGRAGIFRTLRPRPAVQWGRSQLWSAKVRVVIASE